MNNGLVSQAVLIELYRFALLLSGRGDSAGRALDSVFSDCERGIAQIRDESHRVAWLVARLRQSFMAGASGSHESSVPARDDDSEIFDGDLPRDALILAPRFHALPEPERSEGLHAGLAETSLMLHLAPQQTRASREPDGLGVEAGAPPGWSLEGAAPCAWLTAEISRSGVIGDPRGASPSLGADLFERLVAGWWLRLDGLLRSEWPPMATRR